VRKGGNKAFAYTLKFTVEKNETQIHKKRSISASEFVALKANKVQHLAELNSSRICTMEKDIYMIIDYYPEVQDQPIIVILQIDQQLQLGQDKRPPQPPVYLKIDKEITDMAEYQHMGLAKRVNMDIEAEEKKPSSDISE